MCLYLVLVWRHLYKRWRCASTASDLIYDAKVVRYHDRAFRSEMIIRYAKTRYGKDLQIVTPVLLLTLPYSHFPLLQ